MKRIREVIVVEGRYDKNAIKQVVNATVVETKGFGVFKDKERLDLLRKLARNRGLILLTDSDGAGFVIRNFLKGAIPKEQIKHAYIPDVHGKERRKAVPGKEGKLGVEGMSPQTLVDALARAGATFEGEGEAPSRSAPITRGDLYDWGLMGRPDSAHRRARLLKQLELPEHMSTAAMLEALNLLYGRDDPILVHQIASSQGMP